MAAAVQAGAGPSESMANFWRAKAAVVVLLLLAAVSVTASASAFTVTDILGRKVELNTPAKRVILGEGRFLAVLGALDMREPLAYVAGMMNEFRRYDPAGMARYRKVFPEIDRVPTFGQSSAQSVSVEQAIALQADVAIFSVRGHGPGASSTHITERLASVGIPTVFIDFRQHPLVNTARSVEIVGQVLGRTKQAKAFAAFYRQELARVTDRIKEKPPASCPRVLLDLRVGLGGGCCTTVAEGLYADMVEAVGGCNIAKGRLPGAIGQLSLEHVLSSSPEVYIGSAVGSTRDHLASGQLTLGAGVDKQMAQQSLANSMRRPGFPQMPAVKNKRAHAIWHHFYNSPLNIYAVQKFAQWLHPELFVDLRPEKTLQHMLEFFRPVDLSGTYATSLR